MTAEERERLALEILYRCVQYRDGNAPSPLEGTVDAGVTLDANHLYLLGDLAIGLGGTEFTYRYLPIRFVERLIDEAEALALDEKDVEVTTQDGRSVVIETDPEDLSLADVLVTTATLYLLNNLRAKLNEAIEELFVEALEVAGSINQAAAQDFVHMLSFDTHREIKTLRTRIINRILERTEPERRRRLEEALWDIDPAMRLADLPRHYSELKGVWREAWKVYKANKNFATWRETVRREIKARYSVTLPSEGPMDLISFLSDKITDYPTAPRAEFEPSPSGIALEHAARLCGAGRFEFATGTLRQIVSKANISPPDKSN